MQKLLLTLGTFVSSIVCFAEQTQSIQKSFKQDPFNHPIFPAVMTTGFAGVVLVLLIAVGIYLMRTTRFLKTRINYEPVLIDQPKLVVIPIRVNRKWTLYGSLGVIIIIVIALVLTGFNFI